MGESQSETHPAPVYRRIAQNRRKTGLIVIFLAAALAPFVLGVGYLIAAGLVRFTFSETWRFTDEVRSDEDYLERMRDQPRGETSLSVEKDLVIERAALARSRQADASLTLRLMPVTAGALAATLGLLLWATGSSPTTKLLAQLGALPAGSAEIEAARLLENLSLRAGLPSPRLYIIYSGVPNMLSSGIDTRNALIAVTRGALDLLDKEELEGLMAHELSHIGNHDIRLNAALASVSLFMRVPSRLLRDRLSSVGANRFSMKLRLVLLELALTPVGLYIFFVAPILGRLVRAVVSREREFVADADAVLLTRNPAGLLRALAKIGAARSAMPGSTLAFAHSCLADPGASGSPLGGNFVATHIPLAKRIHRLVESYGAATVTGLEEAVEKGKQYARRHPAMVHDTALLPSARDELAALRQGDVMGRVHRLLSAQAVPVYQTDKPHAFVIGWVKPGELVVAFDDPGKMRQVNTAQEVYGYIDRKVSLKAVEGVLPQEVYDPTARAAAEEALARREEAAAAQPAPGLTREQYCMAVGLGAAVFAGLTILLLVLYGK